MLELELTQNFAGGSGTALTALTPTSGQGLLTGSYTMVAGTAATDGTGGLYTTSSVPYQASNGSTLPSPNVRADLNITVAGSISANCGPTIFLRTAAGNSDAYYFGIYAPVSTAFNFGIHKSGSYVSFATSAYFSGMAANNVFYNGVNASLAAGVQANLSAFISTCTWNGSNAVAMAVYCNQRLAFIGIDTTPTTNLLTNVGFEPYSYGPNATAPETTTTGAHITGWSIYDWTGNQPPFPTAPGAPSISLVTTTTTDTITSTAPTGGFNISGGYGNVSGATLDMSSDGVNWAIGVQTISTYNASGYVFTRPTSSGSPNYYRVRGYDTLGFYGLPSNVVTSATTYTGSPSIPASTATSVSINGVTLLASASTGAIVIDS